jgi:hypothetical protein
MSNSETAAGDDEHVLNAAGEFAVHDEPIDLSHYHFEDWIAFGLFWVLALVTYIPSISLWLPKRFQ